MTKRMMGKMNEKAVALDLLDRLLDAMQESCRGLNRLGALKVVRGALDVLRKEWDDKEAECAYHATTGE